MRFIITPPTSYPEPVPEGSVSEKELREFAAGLNPHISWKKAMQEKPLEDVITAMEANAFEVDQEDA